MESKRPHIIIFNPDEMRADALGHLGNQAALTPHLDQFVQEDAVSFSQTFCQNPVCVPSRCSFFTGTYPHTCGHRTMGHLLHPGEDSLLKELKDSGYYVWMNDRNDLTAGQIPGWTESQADEIYYSGQMKRAPGPVSNCRGEEGGKYYYSHYEGKLGLDENNRNYSSDDEVVDAAIARLKNPPDDRPMCLFMGLFYPHPPYQIEEPYFSAINRDLLPVRIKAQECSGKAKILEKIRGYQHMETFSEEEWDELRAVYLGMCMKVDALFGRLVRALKELGIYEDCAIFFLSDHGDFAGDYGLTEKCQNSFEDCLTRVPFLVKAPGKGGRSGISSALTELVDFYATAMDYAGVVPGHTHFGHSLRGIIEGKTEVNRPYVFSEGGRNPGEIHCDEYHEAGPNGLSAKSVYWPKAMAQTDDEAHAKGIMMRTDRYKYISRTIGRDEFYDLEKDPYEMQNRIDDPTYASQINKMMKQMLKWLQETADIVPFAYDKRFTDEMIWARVRNLIYSEADERLVRRMIREGRGLPEIMQFCKSREEG